MILKAVAATGHPSTATGSWLPALKQFAQKGLGIMYVYSREKDFWLNTDCNSYFKI